MLIQIEEKQTVTKSIELKLPAFYKDYNHYHMINEKETLITLFISADYFSMRVMTKEISTYNIDVTEALEGSPIEHEDFYAVWDKIIKKLENEVLKPTI